MEEKSKIPFHYGYVLTALLFATGCLFTGCGGGGGDSSPSDYSRSAFTIFQQKYFQPERVRAPQENDTLQSYVQSYRDPVLDIYTSYFGPENLRRVLESLETEETRFVRVYAPDILYVSFDGFSSGTAGRLIRDINAKIAEGNVGKLLLDLRVNSGGLPEEAVILLDYLTTARPDGTMIYRAVSGDGAETAYRVNDGTNPFGKETLFGKDSTIVLTSGYTASAAEIVTAGLVFFEEGTQTGTVTFGKNRIVTFYRTARGDGFEMTSGRVFHADGTDREGTGLVPAVVTETPFDAAMSSWGGSARDPLQEDYGIPDQSMTVLYQMEYWRNRVLTSDFSAKAGDPRTKGLRPAGRPEIFDFGAPPEPFRQSHRPAPGKRGAGKKD